MKKLLTSIAAFVFCSLFYTTVASAEPVNWVVTTRFSVGGPPAYTIAGSFTFDADTGIASNVNLQLDAGASLLSNCTAAASVTATLISCGGFNDVLASALTDAGGTVHQAGGQPGVLTGTVAVTPAPEPQSYVLSLLGLAALGTARGYASRKTTS